MGNMDVQVERRSYQIGSSGIELVSGMPICQTDLPLDWYQEEYKPYAEEYLALPDRTPETVLTWMDSYIKPAKKTFGDQLLLLAHYYMGGEIVKLIEHYGGMVSDSYALALQAVRNPQAKIIVESAVHFMAESIAILAHEDQRVFITNPKAGCTLEMMAEPDVVEMVIDELQQYYDEGLKVITYMNTSGRLKALSGLSNGATCTSSNATRIVGWALDSSDKVLFVPDHCLGENIAWQLELPESQVYTLPPINEIESFSIDAMPIGEREKMDKASFLLWPGFCGVHTVFKPEHVDFWHEKGYQVLVHPESHNDVLVKADGYGSTAYLWNAIQSAPKGSKLAIGTEGHFVRNAAEQAALHGKKVVNLADIATDSLQAFGCGCATMSRNDPPHLVATLDLLQKGDIPELNELKPGDKVNPRTGWCERLDTQGQNVIKREATKSLDQMIRLTEKNQ